MPCSAFAVSWQPPTSSCTDSPACGHGPEVGHLVAEGKRVEWNGVDVVAATGDEGRRLRRQRRSLWLTYAIAGRIIEEPTWALDLTTKNIECMQAATKGRPLRWLDEWSRMLQGPLERLLLDFTSPSPRGRELRQNAPFAGVLDDAERLNILARWKEST